MNPRGVPEIVCGLPQHPRLVYAGPMQVPPDDLLSTGLLQQCLSTGSPLGGDGEPVLPGDIGEGFEAVGGWIVLDTHPSAMASWEGVGALSPGFVTALLLSDRKHLGVIGC